MSGCAAIVPSRSPSPTASRQAVGSAVTSGSSTPEAARSDKPRFMRQKGALFARSHRMNGRRARAGRVIAAPSGLRRRHMARAKRGVRVVRMWCDHAQARRGCGRHHRRTCPSTHPRPPHQHMRHLLVDRHREDAGMVGRQDEEAAVRSGRPRGHPRRSDWLDRLRLSTRGTHPRPPRRVPRHRGRLEAHPPPLRRGLYELR